MLTTYKGLYVFKSGYKNDIPRVAGFKYDPKKKMWWTRDIDTAKKLADHADEKTFLLLKKQDQTYAESFSVENELYVPAPPGLSYLPFQKAGINFLYKNKKALLADEPGTGKTIQTIGLINLDTSIKRVLIICPSILVLNWQSELKKWLNRNLSITAMMGNAIPGADIMIISYNRFMDANADYAFMTDWDLLVIDESHYLKSEKALRTRAIYSPFLTMRCKRIVCLTGTPVINRPMDLWTTISVLDPETWWSRADFENRYCGGIQPGLARRKIQATREQELNTKLRSTIMLRREKKHVLKELPPKIRQIIELPIFKDEIKSLLSLEKKYYEMAEKESNGLLLKDNYEDTIEGLKEKQKPRMTEMSGIRHRLGMLKAEQYARYIMQYLSKENEKTIVYFHHVDVLEAFRKQCQASQVIITGKSTASQRQNAIKQFQNNKDLKFIFATTQTAGIGITLTAAKRVVFIEPEWTPAALTQAEDRANRIGSTEPLLIQHYVFEDSLDVNMLKKVFEKQKMIEQVCA